MSHGRDFFLIGAGFSRAISPNMPLLSDLAKVVLPQLNVERSELDAFGGDFEMWMSHIAVDQPWLSDSANFRNRALFLEASVAVHDAITSAERAARTEPPPQWLVKLLLHWSANGDIVCSFNYDLLIERALTSLDIARAWADLYAVPLAARTPAGSGRMLSAAPPRGGAPTLVKLHGSTSWAYGGPSAPVSDRITLTVDRATWNESEPRTPSAGRYTALYADLTPLIVPPTTTKGAFYGNLGLRAQWRRAFEELSSATKLTIIGYSFPPGDLQARSFVAQAVRQDTPVTVVDQAPSAAETVARLLRRTDIATFSGPDALANFAESTCGHLIRWGVSYEEGPTPVLTIDGVDAVPANWWDAEVQGRRPEAADADRWLAEALATHWSGRAPDVFDNWTPWAGSTRPLQIAYVARGASAS